MAPRVILSLILPNFPAETAPLYRDPSVCRAGLGGSGGMAQASFSCWVCSPLSPLLTESPQERPGSRRSLPGSLSEKSPSMEPSAASPFRVTVTISASPPPPLPPPSPPGPGVLLCDPAVPLPGASRTGRASSLPRSRYPTPPLLPSPWLRPAPGATWVPSFKGGVRCRTGRPEGHQMWSAVELPGPGRGEAGLGPCTPRTRAPPPGRCCLSRWPTAGHHSVLSWWEIKSFCILQSMRP